MTQVLAPNRNGSRDVAFVVPGSPVDHRPSIDVDRATEAVTVLLESLGLDPNDDGLSETPRRVVHALMELTKPIAFQPTTFPNDAGYDELILVRDIPFVSLCEHHLLPFRGAAHIGYLPGERIIGLSKLARLVGSFARRPQLQERMTAQIADWVRDHLDPRGVGVIVEAEHLCMGIRGPRSEGTTTVTSALHGLLRERPAARQEFLQLARPTSGRPA